MKTIYLLTMITENPSADKTGYYSSKKTGYYSSKKKVEKAIKFWKNEADNLKDYFGKTTFETKEIILDIGMN